MAEVGAIAGIGLPSGVPSPDLAPGVVAPLISNREAGATAEQGGDHVAVSIIDRESDDGCVGVGVAVDVVDPASSEPISDVLIPAAGQGVGGVIFLHEHLSVVDGTLCCCSSTRWPSSCRC